MNTIYPLIPGTAAVIFDVDGTLVDTVDFHAEAWQRAFSQFGFHFPFETIRSQIGKGGDQLMPVFLAPDELERNGKNIEAFRAVLIEKEYFPRVKAFPKVRELFSFLISSGIQVALGSSAKTKDLSVYKQVAGIDDIELVETTSEDAERSKPYPDIFAAALERLALTSGQVMVVGDTPYDVEAAMKAGMKTIGLLSGGFSASSLRDAGAVNIFSDPEHLLQTLRSSDNQ